MASPHPYTSVLINHIVMGIVVYQKAPTYTDTIVAASSWKRSSLAYALFEQCRENYKLDELCVIHNLLYSVYRQ